MRDEKGRFIQGHKEGVRFKKGQQPWYKQKGLPNPNKGNVDKQNENRFSSFLYKEWRNAVLNKSLGKCAKCAGNYRLSAHHIKPWKEDEQLRFDVENGVALCNSCHGKEEGFQKGRISELSAEARKKIGLSHRGRKASDETRRKQSLAKKGKPSGRKGMKHSDETKLKMRLAKLGKPCFNGFKKNNTPWNKGAKFNELIEVNYGF